MFTNFQHNSLKIGCVTNYGNLRLIEQQLTYCHLAYFVYIFTILGYYYLYINAFISHRLQHGVNSKLQNQVHFIQSVQSTYTLTQGASLNYVGKIVPFFAPSALRRQVYYISLCSSIGIWLIPSPSPAYVVYGCPLIF